MSLLGVLAIIFIIIIIFIFGLIGFVFAFGTDVKDPKTYTNDPINSGNGDNGNGDNGDGDNGDSGNGDNGDSGNGDNGDSGNGDNGDSGNGEESPWEKFKLKPAGSVQDWAHNIYKAITGANIWREEGGVKHVANVNIGDKTYLSKTTADQICENPCYWYKDKVTENDMCSCDPAEAINF